MSKPTARRLAVSRSPAAFDENSQVLRLPRWPGRKRPDGFHAAFDSQQIFYDVFWHVDGARVLGIGPAPRNLLKLYRGARAIALPSRKELRFRLHVSLSTMTVEWLDVPAGTLALEVQFGGQVLALPVQPNLAPDFIGHRMLFTMNKNNDLEWIRYWAEWHVRLHGTDGIVLFDNGSDRYGLAEIEAVLASVAGLRTYAVVDFSHKFGPIDPAVKVDPYWSRFAQISSMGIVLRRFGSRAQGLLNCDIDELANAPHGQSLYDVVRNTPHGLLILLGRWVEPNRISDGGESGAHGQFGLVHKDKKVRDGSPVKWILDPGRPWVQSLGVHPYWHWVHGRPRFGKSFAEGAYFWHFRGINTGWKVKERVEARADAEALSVDAELIGVRGQLESSHGPTP